MADAAKLRSMAGKFRALAKDADERTAADLRMLADVYEDEARRVDPVLQPGAPRRA